MTTPFTFHGGGDSSRSRIFGLGIRGGSIETDETSDLPPQQPPQLILIIDVDNTLYDEHHLRRTHGLGIEEQIIENTYAFFKEYLNETCERSQQLYHQYGSAIEGIRHEYWNHCKEEELEQWMRRYYNHVYDDIDVSCLYHNTHWHLSQTISRQLDDGDVDQENGAKTTIITGYSHGASQDLLRCYLKGLSSYAHVKLYLASNSPKLHVDKVLRALGLDGIPWAGILTPDTVIDITTTNNTFLSYPTKHNPRLFFHKLLQQRSGDTDKIILLDDSMYNLQRAREELGFDGMHVQHGDDHNDGHSSLLSALHQALSHLYVDDDHSLAYTFDDVSYLKSKNVVDRTSINRNIYHRLAHELTQRLQQQSTGLGDNPDELCIVDLGAGLLSMLEMFASPLENDQQSSFFHTIQDMIQRPLKRVEYYAYESNPALLDECQSTLDRLGFEPVPYDAKISSHHHKHHAFQRHHDGIEIRVHLMNSDFRQEQPDQRNTMMVAPQLVVGCCFADLFPPQELVPALLGFLSKISSHPTDKNGPGPLLYFPITFTGSTQFVPPQPFEWSNQERATTSIPSDTTAFGYYARALQDRGHNLDPSLLVDEMERYGVELVDSGSSPWIIDPSHHEYLWRTMMHFFARTGSPAILQHGWDAFGWLRRAFTKRPKIVVSNVDLLFRLPQIKGRGESLTMYGRFHDESNNGLIEEIQFVAPRCVTTIQNNAEAKLLPNQIRVESVCSLISSGTELKIFQGMFSEDALDVNIKGMSDQTMSYPLAYGYSMVGRVVECGSGVANAQDILGRLVFSFSAHSTGMILDLDSIHLVPDGIAAQDAMFMPSVETALSIVHDAHVRVGENVAVYGQGLIGLLVTSILNLEKLGPDASSGKFGTITTFDSLTDRLAASGMLGASQALLPSEASIAGPFDVSIEVSGNPRALQSAIDNTSDGGRIVVASWYGNAQVSLKLGMDFHRSHKTIQTSQVSELPAGLTGLWTKQRRFALTWELVKNIRPSRLLTKRTTLDKAQEAYAALCNGTEIAVAFDYETR